MPDLRVRPNDSNKVYLGVVHDQGPESALVADATAFKINWKLYTWLKCTAEENRRDISQVVEEALKAHLADLQADSWARG
jgi:hypothetical protein